MIALSSDDAVARAEAGEDVVLLRPTTSADDIRGMAAARAVVTARGGMTSHAAVVARGMGRPCVVGCEELTFDEDGVVRAGGQTLRAGDTISVDGASGEVFAGAIATTPSSGDAQLDRVLGWADARRRLRVLANADDAETIEVALRLGAEGVGLCRTEHMFFAPDRLVAMREMILARDDDERARALRQIEEAQREDFRAMFEVLDGRPICVRLLDPPLHEFLPTTDEEVRAVAADLGVSADEVVAAVDAHTEANPMLGQRGVRLALATPAIPRAQLRALFGAARAHRAAGGEVAVEVMIPLVASAAELARMRTIVDDELARARAADEGLAVRFGSMIELPRACLRAGALAGARVVLLVRDERPHPDDVGHEPRRHPRDPRGLSRRPRAAREPLLHPRSVGRR